MAVYLVCEGYRQGLDDRVLDALVVQFHRLAVLIEPAGGSKGSGAVRHYLETSGSRNVAIAVEDRDYRPRSTAHATWVNPSGKSFVWRRHELENYLLDPRVVLELFNDFRSAGRPSWADAIPTNEPDVAALLQQLASPLLEEYVAEVLKAELVQLLNGVGNLVFGCPRPALAPGAHACTQLEWVPALQREAARLCQACNAAAALPDLQPAAITARYQTLLAQVQAPAFLTSGDYLIDVGGKELLACLRRHLQSQGAPGGLDLEDGLLQVLKRIYQPNLLYRPDDFDELATMLRSLV